MTLCIFLILFALQGIVQTKVTEIDFKTWADEKYYALTYNKTQLKSDVVFSILFNQTEEIFLRQTSRLTVTIADSSDITHYTRALMDTSLDLCKVGNFLRASPLVKIVLTNVLDCLEIEKIECPYKKGIIRLENCKLSSLSVPETNEDCRFKFVFATTGKLRSKKWIPIYRIEMYGLYRGKNSL